MLVIAGTITIDPANFDKLKAAAAQMMAETHKEPGNLAYVFSAGLEDPATIHIFAHWESQAALDLHFKAPHMAAFQAAIGGLGVKDMKIQKFEISSVGPL